MEKQKMTLEEKLLARKNKTPPTLIYLFLACVWRLLFTKRLNINYKYEIDLKKFAKQPYIVVSNHLSRLDYLYTGLAFFPHRLNFVAGYNEFFRSHLAFVFKMLQVIPKKNFTTDINTIKQSARVLKKGGKLVVFPEGMSSISGSNQPIALGSGKFLKHFGVPVLMTKIAGGYLTNTKHCLDERPGRVDVVVSQLFSCEQLKQMTESEIQDKLNEVLRHDDYLWNKTEHIKFDGKGQMAKNFKDYAYLCPKCKSEFTLETDGNIVKCTACGNGAEIDEFYDMNPLDETCQLPVTPKEWFDLQRRTVHQQLLEDENFQLREKVELGVLGKFELLKNKKTSEKVGRGEIILNRRGLAYVGTKNGEKFEFFVASENLPTFGMCTDMSGFQVYEKGQYFEFYPETHCVAKWLLVAEENHRINGGKWQNFKDFKY